MDEHGGLDDQVEAAWGRFRERLGDWIAAMAVDEVLHLQVLTGVDDDDLVGAAPYVQVLRWDQDAVRAEVAGNGYLDPRWALRDDQVALLAELGWEAPEEEPGNHHVDGEPREADRLAALGVAALREVFGCLHPCFVVSDLDEVEDAVARVRTEEPEELAVMPTDDEHLRALVDDALRVMLGDDLTHDEDGDVPVVAGRSLVWVRVLEDLPAIDLFAHVVLGVREHDRVADELALLNAGQRHFTFVRVDDHVVMRARLVALPFAPSQLRGLLSIMLGEVDETARDLAARLGGHRFLEGLTGERTATAPEPPTALVALLESLHEGPMRPSSVAALFDQDRLAIIGTLVAVRRDDLDCDGHDREVVLTHLRRALRHVSDGEARAHREAQERRPRPRRTQQLSLIEVDDAQASLDAGGWEREVS